MSSAETLACQASLLWCMLKTCQMYRKCCKTLIDVLVSCNLVISSHSGSSHESTAPSDISRHAAQYKRSHIMYIHSFYMIANPAFGQVRHKDTKWPGKYTTGKDIHLSNSDNVSLYNK